MATKLRKVRKKSLHEVYDLGVIQRIGGGERRGLWLIEIEEEEEEEGRERRRREKRRRIKIKRRIIIYYYWNYYLWLYKYLTEKMSSSPIFNKIGGGSIWYKVVAWCSLAISFITLLQYFFTILLPPTTTTHHPSYHKRRKWCWRAITAIAHQTHTHT